MSSQQLDDRIYAIDQLARGALELAAKSPGGNPLEPGLMLLIRAVLCVATAINNGECR